MNTTVQLDMELVIANIATSFEHIRGRNPRDEDYTGLRRNVRMLAQAVDPEGKGMAQRLNYGTQHHVLTTENGRDRLARQLQEAIEAYRARASA